MSAFLGLILKTGLDVSSTGFIKIVGSDEKNKCSVDRYDWDYIAAEYDPLTQEAKPNPWFKVEKDEILEWLKNS